MITPYYERNGITIYCGDCLSVMPKLEPPIDMILADLPYGTTACSWDTVIPFEPLWENYKRIIKEHGAVVLTGSQPFTSMLVMSNLNWFKYEWIWDKQGTANFAIAKIQPLRASENILVFSNGRTNYYPQMRTGKVRMKGGGGKCEINGMNPIHSVNGLYYPTNVIKISNANFSERGLHPTQKPTALMAYLIRTYTNPGELVLDNTMGSGTTLLAAQNEGRRAIGIEINEEYCKIAVDRLRQPSFFSIPDEPKPKPKQASLLESS